MAEPGQLTLGEPSCRLLGERDRAVERKVPGQIPHEFRRPDRLHDRQGALEAATQERTRFLNRAFPEHSIEAGVGGGVERRAARLDNDPGVDPVSDRRTGLFPEAR